MRFHKRLVAAMFFVFASLVSSGCDQPPRGENNGKANSTTSDQIVAQTKPAAKKPREKIDETKGYLHKASNVGFIYPDGWENLGAQALGPITQLGLRKGEGDIEVTLYWSPLDSRIGPADVGQVEAIALRRFYKDKVGETVKATSGSKSGFKIPINGGPLGKDDPELSGVVYVFAVRRESKVWKIKVRATVRGKEKLDTVHALLENYRWPK